MNSNQILNDSLFSDKVFLYLSIFHIPIIALFSFNLGTFTIVIIPAILLVIIHFIAYYFLRNTFSLKIITGIVLMSFSILLIQAQLGRIEMHFHIFCALAFLLLYQDWRIIPVGAAYVAIHHLVGNYLQEGNCKIGEIPIVIFNYGTGIDIVLVHAFFVIFESSILIYISIYLNKLKLDNIKKINYLSENKKLIESILQNIKEKNSDFENSLMEYHQKLEFSNHSLEQSLNQFQSITRLIEDFYLLSQEIKSSSKVQSDSFVNLQNETNDSILLLDNYIKEHNDLNTLIFSSIETLEKEFDNFEKLKFNSNQITTKSKELSNITSIINDIADKVNLLSLNASIEAARAGDYGRGFAVVAEEISKLSHSTTNSTKEIFQISNGITKLISQNYVTIEKIYTLVVGLKESFNKINTTLSGVSEKLELLNKRFSILNRTLTNLQKISIKLEEKSSNQFIQIQNVLENNLIQTIQTNSQNHLSSLNNILFEFSKKMKNINEEISKKLKSIIQ